MKWIPISKAKVKFGQRYLLAFKTDMPPVTATLYKSETHADGVKHTFTTTEASLETSVATHIAIITEPTEG